MQKIKFIILFFITSLYADPFEFEQSGLQSAYFISNVLINNEQIDSDDWVGAFCGEQCVGGRQWDTSLCGSGICDVIAMGNDGTGDTDGYCVNGDEVSFQIYDSSEDVYLDAVPSENQAWTVNGFTFIENLAATSDGDGGEITDGCDLPESSSTNYLHLTADGTVLYKSNSAIGGFQFDVDGATISSGSGGDMSAFGLFWQALGNTFLAFSLTGGSIPAGCGTLVNLSLNGEATGLSNIIIADAAGGQIYFEYYEGGVSEPVLGCTDMGACNYDSFADENDGSCWYPENQGWCDCEGNIVDECGVCAGGNADKDCNDDCFGSALDDSCGVCSGGNSGHVADSDLDACGHCFGGVADTDGDGTCDTEDVEPTCATNDTDDCGVCAGGNADKDCEGECFGDAIVDNCGECNSSNSTCIWVPNGPDWFYSQSTLLAFVALEFLTIDGEIAAGDGTGASNQSEECYGTGECDVVGAFIDRGDGAGEVCVGWQYANPSYTTVPLNGFDGINMNGLQAGEVPYLKIWDASTQSELDISLSGDIGGFANLQFFILNGISTAYNNINFPNWSFGPDEFGAFQFTSSFTGWVNNAGQQLGDEGDLLAAFDSDGNIRGLATELIAPFGPYAGTILYELQVYSHDAGDVLSFQFYDASEDEVLDISNTYVFVIYDILGNVADPYEFEVENEDLGCPPCEDVAITNYSFDCATAVSVFAGAGGCDFGTLSEQCPVTCGLCPEEDECGVCEGDGSSCENDWDGDACTMPNHSIHITSSGSVLYNSSSDIAGFQFNVDGAGVLDAFGGAAGDAGFLISASGATVLGISLSGATIEGGCGTLVEVSVDGEPSGLYDFVIAGYDDNVTIELPFEYFDGSGGEPDVYGCTDMGACNYNPDANMDDGSCEYSSCNQTPENFQYNQSTQQAFYYFENVIINDELIDSNDWIAAFKGDICVGSRQWGVCEGNREFCDIPVMGNDGLETTLGYMNDGEIPTFKIYDSSTETYYNAVASEDLPWNNFAIYFIDSLSNQIPGCTDDAACNYSEQANYDNGSCYFSEENYDCNGNCIVEIDCYGTCGGEAIVDDCGVCSNGETDHIANSDIDCNGICFGDAILDECDQCNGNGYDFCDDDNDGENNVTDWGYGAHGFGSNGILVEDVPNDQGNRVYITFYKSFYDTDTLRGTEFYTIERLDNNNWTSLHSIGAYGSESYQTIAETLINATENDTTFSEFRVIASMEEGNFVNLEDENGFGFSVDNIHPSTPLSMSASHNDNQITIQWEYEFEEDFNYHEIIGLYNSTYSVENSFNIQLDNYANEEYRINAVDINGNKSETSKSIMAKHLSIGPNLVSFNVLPEDVSVYNILHSLGENVTAIITESGACTQISSGYWVGSHCNIKAERGYWIIVNNDDILFVVGTPTNRNEPYPLQLLWGANLVSYPYRYEREVSESLTEDLQEVLIGVISQSASCVQVERDVWAGSSCNFKGTNGYWFIMDSPHPLYFINGCDDIECNYLTRKIDSIKKYPDNYHYNQSMRQAFYFISSIENITFGDWLLAYNDDILIGAKEWTGDIIELPVMGNDGYNYSEGYIELNQIPKFKILNQNGQLIELNGDIPEWSDNGIYFISQLDKMIHLPEKYSLNPAYPNPFNPITNISFNTPKNDHITIIVYDIKGNIVDTIVDQIFEAGYHSAKWNGTAYSSGIYFINMISESFTSSQKLTLVK